MAAMLTENLFIDNVNDAKLLKQDAFLDKIAQGHVNGLVKVFGLKKKAEPKPAPKPAPKDEGKLYRVQVGAFKERENAERLVEELKKKGYPAFITQ